MPKLPTCTAQTKGGGFCDAPALEAMPFPICFRHASSLWLAFQRHMVSTSADNHKREATSSPDPGGLVYYLRVGDQVKIGFTTNLRKRMQALSFTMSEVVATEPGTETLECRRHRQFAEARVRPEREWFWATEDLVRHIDALASASKLTTHKMSS